MEKVNPLNWEQIQQDERYAVVYITGAGDWAIDWLTFNKQNSWFKLTTESGRVYATLAEAEQFIHTMQKLGGKNG